VPLSLTDAQGDEEREAGSDALEDALRETRDEPDGPPVGVNVIAAVFDAAAGVVETRPEAVSPLLALASVLPRAVKVVESQLLLLATGDALAVPHDETTTLELNGALRVTLMLALPQGELLLLLPVDEVDVALPKGELLAEELGVILELLQLLTDDTMLSDGDVVERYVIEPAPLALHETLSLTVALPVDDLCALTDKLAKTLKDAHAESCAVALFVFDTIGVIDVQLVAERVLADDCDAKCVAAPVPDRKGESVAETVAVADLLINLLPLPVTQVVALPLGASCVAEKRALDVV
jgi:hypothetical protein